MQDNDLISRQAAIDACLKGKTDGLPATNVACDCCAERIRVLPSAQPTQSNTSNTLESLDCIDRQAAIEVADAIWCVTGDKNVAKVWDQIKGLPSAQPERDKGEWIGTEFDGYADGNPVYYEWKCSVCGCVVEDEEPAWNYCPNCGADMRGEQDDGKRSN